MENRVRRVVVPTFKGDEKSFPFWMKRMEHHLKQEELLYTLDKLPSEEDYAQPAAGATAAAEAERKTKYEKRLKDDLHCNLLSVSRIESAGKSVCFSKGSVEIRDESGRVVARGVRVGGLYQLNVSLFSTNEMAQVGKSITGLNIWHRRFGHLGDANLLRLVRENMVEGLDVQHSSLPCDSAICKPCVEGKQSRDPFNGGHMPRSRRPLELVHSDVCGQMSEDTYDGYRYFVSFIDDYTHFVMVYLIRNKSEVLQKFKEFESFATAHFSTRISRFRSDNGGEYYGNNFISFCREKGILMVPTVPYTPQQNGVSERMNRTLMEKVRSMLSDSGAPAELWGEALYVSTYLTNRSPTVSLTDAKTPYEMWFGSVPQVRNLKVFGSTSYAHINKEHRSKLEKKSNRLCFVGYAPNGYRLWDSGNRKIVVSRDVIFDESNPYFLSSGRTETQTEDNMADLPIVEVFKTCDQTEMDLVSENDNSSTS